MMTQIEDYNLHLQEQLAQEEQAREELARELDLQEVTIKLHVKTLCRKLDAKNRTHAAMIGKEAGIV